MPKPIPVPTELDQGFWDAVNERRLVVQYCNVHSRMQHPPEATCRECGNGDNLGWREVNGRGTINDYCVMYDTRTVALKEYQPFNIAVIKLDENPDIQFFSLLPGVPADEVPVGGSVEVMFEEVAPGTLIPEWRVV